MYQPTTEQKRAKIRKAKEADTPMPSGNIDVTGMMAHNRSKRAVARSSKGEQQPKANMLRERRLKKSTDRTTDVAIKRRKAATQQVFRSGVDPRTGPGQSRVIQTEQKSYLAESKDRQANPPQKRKVVPKPAKKKTTATKKKAAAKKR